MAASPDPRQRLAWAHLRAWSRPANPEECNRGLDYVDEFRRQATGLSSAQRELGAWSSYARVLFCANEFVYVD